MFAHGPRPGQPDIHWKPGLSARGEELSSLPCARAFRHFIPDRLTFPKPAPVLSPRLVSEAEMSRALAVADQLPPSADNPLRAETIRAGLILLFCCGLRRGELLRLTLGDIQEEQTVIRIRLSSSTTPVGAALPLSDVRTEGDLQKRRRKRLPMAPEAFLMWSRQRSPEVYGANNLGILWRRICVSAGILDRHGHPPRLHDLRHSAAVLVLQHWYAQGWTCRPGCASGRLPRSR